MFHRIRCLVRLFLAEQRGAVAVLAAVMLTPLVVAAGVATDFSREAIMKAQLQTVADSAAIAGASELSQANGSTLGPSLANSYFTKAVATIVNGASVGTPTITPGATSMTVTATATLKVTLMAIVSGPMTVSVTATASGPAYAATVNETGPFSASAGDGNTIYWYIVPPGGGIPTNLSDYHLLYTNNPSIDSNFTADNATAKTIPVSASQSIGFAMYNQTGAISSYGNNGYGSAPGATHGFFSSLSPPSNLTIPPEYSQYGQYGGYTTQQPYYTNTSVTCNPNSKQQIQGTLNTYQATESPGCKTNAHPCTVLSGGTVWQNNLLVNGACSTPANAVLNCAQIGSGTVSFAWNDMGGTSDDFDYNDAVFSMSCGSNTGSSGTVASRAVILTN